MDTPETIAARLAAQIANERFSGPRRLIAIAGPPASGKSTLAANIVEELQAMGQGAGLLAMDGFHLDNAVLEARGLRQRKGAPETFDLAGFHSLLDRLRTGGEVIGPQFDRARDLVIGSSVVFAEADQTIVVEGNYLLLDRPGWRDLHGLWDYSAFLNVAREDLHRRLIARWVEHGFSEAEAREKAERNDLPNADLVCAARLRADAVI